MIRSHLHDGNNKQVVLLGLEPQNMARIREGQPVKVNLHHLDPDGEPIAELPDIDVVIFFAGAEEQALLRAAYGADPWGS